ncbi:MAG: sigma-54 dependent transcriptional regulator [Burkholderiaceae bacterium]
MKHVLVVDDEDGMRRTLELMLQHAGFGVASCAGLAELDAALARQRPDVVLTDLRLGADSGLDALRTVRERAPRAEVILMTAYGTIDTAVEAIKLGAFDYLTKPFGADELIARVHGALERRVAAAAAPGERGLPDADGPGTRKAPMAEALVARSEAMRSVLELVRRIAPTELTVLITGETGTGKSMVAQAIHDASGPTPRRMVSVNCAALPEALLESELFGHEKGAFTGAVALHKGLFEVADGGTLFLDEIECLTPSLQSKLLGVLQDHRIRRVGSNRMLPVATRVIAATNAALDDMAASGAFRQDLFYRLNVARIDIAPLRDRRDDIEPCIERVLADIAARRGGAYRIAAPALQRLLAYRYPGNLRELRNAIEWAVAVGGGAPIELAHLPQAIRDLPVAHGAAGDARAPAGTLKDNERDLIARAVAQHGHNLSQVARELGIGRTTLWRKLKHYGLDH